MGLPRLPYLMTDGLAAPLPIVPVEDEVTGNGPLVNSLILDVTETDSKIDVLCDWNPIEFLILYRLAATPKDAPVATEVEEPVGRSKKHLIEGRAAKGH